MRTLLLIGLAGLGLTASAADAQARFRVRLGRVHAPATVPLAIPHAEPRPAPGLAARRGPAGAGPTYVLLPPRESGTAAVPATAAVAIAEPAAVNAKPAEAAAAPAPARAPIQALAAPRCPTDRVVGTGVGFCQIN